MCGTLVDPPLHEAKPSGTKHTTRPLTKIHNGRPFQRFVMAQLVFDTLEIIEACSGEAGLKEIRKYLPAWGIGGTKLRAHAADPCTLSLSV